MGGLEFYIGKFIHIKMGIRKTPVIKVSMDISRESPEKLVKAANIIFV